MALLTNEVVGKSVPALMWGAIPANTVMDICDGLRSIKRRGGSMNDGTLGSMRVSITGYGTANITTLTFLDMDGCGARGDSPDGVEAL
jgi:hypothetical protein